MQATITFDAAHSYGTPVTATFAITGSLTPTSGIYGASDGLYFQFLVYDMSRGAVVENFIYHNPDPFPGVDSFSLTYDVAAGHPYSIESDFEVDAYVSSFDYDSAGNHIDVVADFSHTLTYTLVGAAGSGHIIGESGHDYFDNPAAVPEPATWAMTLFGFTGLAYAGRRRTSVTVGAA